MTHSNIKIDTPKEINDTIISQIQDAKNSYDKIFSNLETSLDIESDRRTLDTLSTLIENLEFAAEKLLLLDFIDAQDKSMLVTEEEFYKTRCLTEK